MNATALLLPLLPAAWLLPNHYPPWVSAWLEGTAIAVLALAALRCWRHAELPRLWAAAALLAWASVIWQTLSGRIFFSGDALMVALYIGLFLLALAVGSAVVRTGDGSLVLGGSLWRDAPALFATGIVAGAAVSVAIALVQWTDIPFARLWIADLPPDGRPFSNLGQANHFCTAAFLGLAALGVLRESARIGATGFWLGAGFMLLGMVMSGSRTAWVQLLLSLVLCGWFARRAGLRIRPRHVVGLIVLGSALQVVWSPLDDLLARRVDRPLDERLSAGARPAIWRDMLAAVAREPLAGHGWQQIGAAQQSIALDRPPVPVLFEHVDRAHNIVLDLVLWAGIPVGAAIVLLALSALWSQLRRITDPRAVWLMAGALGLLAHAMLEFPLEFAYFLIPLGVSLGMVHAMSRPPRPAITLPRWAVPAGGAAAAGILALVGSDYLQAEENFRMLRLETARIGTTRVVSDVPHLRVLNQLEAFLLLVRTEPKAGMTTQELERMHKVSQRYGMAPALYRYAMALGLNGRPKEAARTLQLLCHIHSRKRCQEAREAWPQMQQRHEALRAVPPP